MMVTQTGMVAMEMECQIDGMYFVDRGERMADGVAVRMSGKEE